MGLIARVHDLPKNSWNSYDDPDRRSLRKGTEYCRYQLVWQRLGFMLSLQSLPLGATVLVLFDYLLTCFDPHHVSLHSFHQGGYDGFQFNADSPS
jgi:hypothetical protein